MFFKSRKSQHDLAIIPTRYQVFIFYGLLAHLDLLNWVLIYFTYSPWKVKIMIKKQIHMYLNFGDLRKKNFCDFVLNPIPENENSKIREIDQKPQNTEIWECNFKNSWNIIQMRSFSHWFSYLANHVSYVCLSRDSDTSRFVILSLFFVVYFSFNAQKVKIVIKKQIHNHLNFIDLKINIFHDFLCFVLSPDLGMCFISTAMGY